MEISRTLPPGRNPIAVNNNSIQFFIFNVLTQQLLKPITESAQDDKNIQK
jgi:hypothetical protein